MFYFTKISTEDIHLLQPEAAIRYYSLKRHLLLDFHSSASNIKDDKYFLGNENRSSISITRIRTSFEWLFPKIIFSIEKDSNFEIFRVRYCLLSFIIFILLVFSITASLYYSITENDLDSDIFSKLFLLIVFLLLTVIEIRLTKKKVFQAIAKFDGLSKN